MSTIPQVSQAMQTVLSTAAEQADARLHYTKRPDRAKFTASTLVQTLVLGWLAHPDATVEQLAHSAARVGADVTPQAIDQRFSLATATLLQQVLSASMQHLIASDGVAIPLLQRFTGVRVHDSTTIVLPDALAQMWAGCGGSTAEHTASALKCGVQLDLLTGALSGLDLADGRASDHRLGVQHAALPKGSLRLADLGFYDLNVLASLSEEAVYWLSKLEPTALISDAAQSARPLLAFVTALGETAQWEGEVWVGKAHRLRGRLLVMRVPQEVADQRRRRIRKTARDKGVTPSAAALALASWTILLTNIPPDLLSLREALILAKVRWQIELLFKLWKSQGQLDSWRTAKPERILCEVYAKLLALVLQHWVLLVGCWVYPDRSLVKAAQVVRDHAVELASAQARVDRLTEVLETIQRVLRRTARMNTRKKHPNTYQLLLALTTEPSQA
jgi:Transposase DDE domain